MCVSVCVCEGVGGFVVELGVQSVGLWELGLLDRDNLYCELCEHDVGCME